VTPRARARAILVLWLGFFGSVFFPWRDFQDHAHWYKVAWIPVVWSPWRVLDLIGNIVAFVPFGALVTLAVRRGGAVDWVLGVAGALLLALGAEVAQVFSHMRIPSITDVMANVSGAAVGIWLVRRRREGRSWRTSKGPPLRSKN
jgi:glycopeptide antibiotics resistance protein